MGNFAIRKINMSLFLQHVVVEVNAHVLYGTFSYKIVLFLKLKVSNLLAQFFNIFHAQTQCRQLKRYSRVFRWPLGLQVFTFGDL